ncbi:MAG: peptide ABC transporter substrate-binding protein [Phycisphaerales bacterium]|nr:peptide ABC transporter substrate-binding protein [Phycisphaerales bacterium]
MGKILAIFGVLLAILVGAVAVDRPPPRAALVLVDDADFITMDPGRMAYMQDLRLAHAIYEQLLNWDLTTSEARVIPGLARRWEVSPDGRVYTFHLEPRARWSNGDPVTAEDFIYAWQRPLMPETAADYSGMFMAIRGGEAFFNFRTQQLASYAGRPASERTPEAAAALRAEADRRFRETVGLRAPDAHTLEVTLERPLPYFLDFAAFGSWSPVHRPTVERFVSVDPGTGRLIQDHTWTKPGTVVTNGPYVLADYRFRRDARLEANPFYWNPGKVRSKSVAIIIIEDQNTGVLAVKTGAAHMHLDVTADYIREMLAQTRRGERDDFWAFPTFGTYFWSFNCMPRLVDGRENPFHNAGVRRAFAMATDRTAIVENVRGAGEKPFNVLVPPGYLPGFRSPAGLPFDPDRARAELERAGWKRVRPGEPPVNSRGEPFPVVEMLFSTASYHKDIALALSNMWERHLGIRTELRGRETKIYRENLKKRDYMVARGGWFGDYADPTTFLDLHRSTDGNNDRGYSNPAYDALLDRAAAEADPARRMEILAEAERLTMDEELPVLPLWQYGWYYLFRPPERDGRPNPGGLRGVALHPRVMQYYWTIEVVP